MLTVGGLYGIVQAVDEESDLIVEIAEGIHVRIARREVATVVKPDDDEEVEGEEDEDEDADRNGSVAELANPEARRCPTRSGEPSRQRKAPLRATQLSR